MKLDLSNTVVIFDEGHNIENIAEEGSSFKISIKSLINAEDEI